jgi:uncharacterized protein (TIGR02145 family)
LTGLKTDFFIFTGFFLITCLLLLPDAKSQQPGSYVFIENKGQIIGQNYQLNPSVKFLYHSPGFNVQLRKDGFSYDVYSVIHHGNNNKDSIRPGSFPDKSVDSTTISVHRLDFNFIGNNPGYTIETSEPSPYYFNYYTTGTPVNGVTHVRSYKEITYRNFYPDIDLIFTVTEDHRFKYNLRINPGGDINVIKFHILGTEPALSAKGAIVLNTIHGTIREMIPSSFILSKKKSFPVSVFFVQTDGIFQLASETQPGNGETLLIDPYPERIWGTYFGGEMGENSSDLIFDGSEYLYFGGSTPSTTNIATAGAFQVIIGGATDGFLTKWNDSGALQWATYLGGSSGDGFTSICMQNNFIICCGGTVSTNAIATPGTFHPSFGGGTGDAFIEKFTTDGIRIWGTYYGGSLFDDGSECAVSFNSIYITGRTKSSDVIASSGCFQPAYGGNQDAFLARFDTSGNRVWGTYYGGSFYEESGCVGTLNDTIIFLTGLTCSLNNISTPGCFQPVKNDTCDAFIARFDKNGQRIWGTYYGGTSSGTGNEDGIYHCVLKSPDMIYFTGVTSSENNISTPGTFQPDYGGNKDGFVTRFDITGNRIWGTYSGGSGLDNILNLSIDDSNYLVVCGWTSSMNNISTPNGWQPSHGGGMWDGYLTRIDSNGNRIWGTYFGGSSYDAALGVVCAGGGIIYLSGGSSSPDNIATPGAYKTQPTLTDAFLVKFCSPPSQPDTITGLTQICRNITSVAYSTLPVTYGSSYQWTVPAGVTISGGQGTTAIVANFGPSAISGYITVKGINACGPGDGDSIYITVHDLPVPVVSGNDSSCTGNIETYFTAAGQSGYQWSLSTGGQVMSGGTPSADSIQVRWLTAGNNWVAVNYTDTNNCEASNPTTFLVYVAVGTPVLVSVSATQNNVCTGTAVSFTATPTNPGVSPQYQWKVNAINASNASNAGFTYVPLNGDVVTCTLTSSNTICTSNNPATSAPITMVVYQLPPVVANTTASAVCTGNPVTLTGSGAASYVWNNGVTNGVPFVPVATNTYIVTGTDANGCSNTAQVTVSVIPALPVSVSVSPSANPVCTGTPIVFTATPVNGGTTPAYQWKVNGINANNATNAVYTYNPASNDLVSCILASSETCTSGNPASCIPYPVSVVPLLPVSVSIAASANPFCPGNSVTFTAAPINGGTSPAYQWKVNASNAGNASNATFSYNPVSGDLVSCILTSSETCVSGSPATSNAITMVVNSNLPASVSIAASANPFCPGNSVTFTATPVNGGTSPGYQWKVNASNASNATNAVYTYNPVSNDLVSCIVTSNLACVTSNPATSPSITMSERSLPGVSFTNCFDTVTFVNAQPIRLKGGLPPGGTYSGPGVNSTTGIFTPSSAGTGLKTITYSYSNVYTCMSSTTKTILVKPAPSFTCGSTFTDPRDNKAYPTVQIGTQCWMSSNLDFGLTIDDLTPQTDNCLTEKYVRYSIFYQWDELMQYTTAEGTQGLCPPGWHIPTSAEWDQLLAYYDGPGQAASPMKDTLLANGFDSYQTGFQYLNNLWAFTTGNFAGSMYWTSTLSAADAPTVSRAVARGLNAYNPSVSRYEAARGDAFNVRCMKD